MIRRPPRSTLFPYNDALPIFLPGKEVRYTAQEQRIAPESCDRRHEPPRLDPLGVWLRACKAMDPGWHEENRPHRSEEHTSELQSPCNLVCRLLLEKKNTLLTE